MLDPAALDPERIVTVLARHGVRYVLVGGLAARLQGFPRVTANADITPSRDADNLPKLALALIELKARIFTVKIPEGFPFDCSAAMLSRADTWHLMTTAGRLNVQFVPAGTDGYEDLKKTASPYRVFGVELHAASLNDLIRSMKTTDTPQDRQDVVVMRAILHGYPVDE